MHLARITPRFGAFPELLTFRCEGCGEVETIEHDPPKDASASSAVCGSAGSRHDALEFPDRKIVLLTRLSEGKEAGQLGFPRRPRNSE
jgi:hypothetical protein